MSQTLRYLSLIVCTLFALTQFFLQMMFAVLSSHIMHRFHVGPAGLSVIASAFFIGYMAMQLLVGTFLDAYKSRNVLSIAALTNSLGCILFATTHIYLIAVLASFIMGIGAAFAFVGMLFNVAHHFPIKYFGFISSFGEMFAMLGAAFGQLYFAKMVQHYGITVPVLSLGAILFLISMLIFIVLFNEKAPQKGHKQSAFKGLAHIITNTNLWRIGLFCGFMFAIVTVFLGVWGVSFIKTIYIVPLNQATAIMIHIFIGIAFGVPIISFIASRYQSYKKVMIISNILAILVFAKIIYFPTTSTVSMSILLFILGVFISAYFIAFAASTSLVKPQDKGKAMGFLNTVTMGLAPILQLITGFTLKALKNADVTLPLHDIQIMLSILLLGLIMACILITTVKPK